MKLAKSLKSRQGLTKQINLFHGITEKNIFVIFDVKIVRIFVIDENDSIEQL